MDFGKLNCRANETATVAASPCLNDTALAQVGQSFAQGYGSYTKLHGQLVFARQLFAFSEKPQVNNFN
ncbi:hypothetical protein D3C72_2334860 [compost metagenome]